MTVEVMARCQQPDCEAEGEEVVQCYVPDDTSQPSEAYCVTHCFDHGYCWSCGYFWAGIELFDMAEDKLCEPCHDDLRNEEEVDEWTWDNWEPYGGYDSAFWRSQPRYLVP